MESDEMLLKFQEQRQVTNLQQEAEDKEKRHINPRKCSVKLKRLSIAPVKVLETSSSIKSQQCEKRSDQSSVKPKAKVCKKLNDYLLNLTFHFLKDALLLIPLEDVHHTLGMLTTNSFTASTQLQRTDFFASK